MGWEKSVMGLKWRQFMGPGMCLLVLVCCLTLGPRPVQGDKVLVMPADWSHWLSMKLLVKELAARGHEMVVLVPETSLLIQSSDFYRTEIFKVPYTKAQIQFVINQLQAKVFFKPPTITDLLNKVLLNYTNMQVKGCERLLYDKPLMQRLKGERFQIMLTDPLLPCGSIVAESFNIPAVYFLRSILCGLDDVATQCPTPPSYVPRLFSGNTDHMDFLGRLNNMIMYVLDSYLCKVIFANFDELTSRYLEQDITYKELLGHGALWLRRYDYSFEYPKPRMPNMIDIGGINCGKQGSLPADLQEFVDESGEDGFVVFSLGSMVSQMPEEKANVFFDAFSRIPQKVVWRYTGVAPDNASANIRVMKWIPQIELLGHPKVKVFITHGGSHGIYEGICNAVPMVMLPLFSDQKHNVLSMSVRGVGEVLSVFDITSDKLVNTLNKVINNSSYKENMLKLSAVHKDRPTEPLDLAVFWTEFVMRHGGAEHLKPAAHNLNWVQYHCLDVILLLITIVITVVMVTIKGCKYCFCRSSRVKMTIKMKSE
ncbi:hypothetical protein DPEC_G00188630 [Dallia pectoralis]|uniref:Uncharacterized protein n=1 Tax=Dallia pectoralis TaxID=75939 RepID=A0ACC2GC52_DALPE|nr:hypothetical protein DPEC_G00188630 [Dallia pectoralis]